MNELEELRNEAYLSTRNNKERMKLFHDKSIVRKILRKIHKSFSMIKGFINFQVNKKLGGIALSL